MFEIREDILEEYAALAVKTGVNVQELKLISWLENVAK